MLCVHKKIIVVISIFFILISEVCSREVVVMGNLEMSDVLTNNVFIFDLTWTWRLLFLLL